MSYSLTTLWHDRQRFLPGVLAVAFSALLIALQCGLLLGLFSITSIPVDHTRADVWVSAPEVLSVDLGRPIQEGSAVALVAMQPEVARTEIYMQGFAYWSKPRHGGTELCMVVGSRLGDDYLGTVDFLTADLRARLMEHGTIVVDESEKDRLGITGVGDYAEISGVQARVVGLVKGVKSLAGPYVFCSLYSAADFLRLRGEVTTYVLAKCHDPSQAASLVGRLNASNTVQAFTKDEFSFRSRMHWLTKTKAGIALGYAAALGLLVGAVVTSQTLYAAVAAQMREYAVLRALGIPRWRMALSVLAQSFWVGLIGVCVALPASFALAEVADQLGVQVQLPAKLLAAAVAITMVMAIGAGLTALRSLRLVEPAMLLR